MIRKATPADIGPMAAFLDAHVETSMFLLGNLEAHGTEDTTHPHGTAFFLRETGDGITGVFGCTNGGFLMCQLPGLGATEAQTYAHLLKGYTLQGMTGDADQVQVILDALPVPEEAWRLNRVEPLYRMDIGGLASDRTVRPPAEADVPRLTEWFAQYMTETGTAPPGELQEAALRRAEMAVGAPRIRILERDGNPVAMAAINASLVERHEAMAEAAEAVSVFLLDECPYEVALMLAGLDPRSAVRPSTTPPPSTLPKEIRDFIRKLLTGS